MARDVLEVDRSRWFFLIIDLFYPDPKVKLLGLERARKRLTVTLSSRFPSILLGGGLGKSVDVAVGVL